MDPPREYVDNDQAFTHNTQQRPRGRQKGAGKRQTPMQPTTYNSPEQAYGTPQQAPQDTGFSQNNMQQDPNQQAFLGQQFLADPMANPMANMAVQYGSQFVPAGKEYVEEKIHSFLSISKLKYYFAVDTAYVLKKLMLLIFPFVHKDWSLKYDKSEPVAPRYEINAPDLYIPSMAFTTYVLVCSYILGIQNRFTPEQLGMTSSSALAWLFIELMLIIMTMYVIGIASQVRYLDLLALCGYKYVGMIFAAIGGLLFKSIGYYSVLLWMSISISFFIARNLKLLINPNVGEDGVSRSGNKRRLYILLCISLMQPLFMYLLTRHLNQFDEVVGKTIKKD